MAVIAAMNAAGLSCEEPMPGEYEGVSAAQSCILDGTEDAIVLRFASEAEKQTYLAAKEPLASVVLGQDWAVQTVLEPSAQKVAAAIGGEVVAGSG